MTGRMHQKPRVIVFTKRLLPYSETFIRNQVLAMRRWHPILAGEEHVKDGLPLNNIDTLLLCPRHLRILHTILYKLCLLLRIPYLPSLLRLKSCKPNLIHAHFGISAVDIWPYARSLNVPLLVTLHGYDITIHKRVWESGKRGWRRKSYPRQLLRLGREQNVHFLAVSEAIRQRAIEFGLPSEKVGVSYIGVDTEHFAPGPVPLDKREPRVLFVGRLVQNKGTAILLEAFARVIKTIPACSLKIVGDGPLRAELEAQARPLGEAVEFTGKLSSDEVHDQMARARVLCLPSITVENGESEGFGLVILEAQSCGLPVVTSARGGATEGIKDGMTGFRFREGDIESLAQYLQRLIEDETLLLRLSSSAITFAHKNFSLLVCTSKLEEIYDSHIEVIISQAHQ